MAQTSILAIRLDLITDYSQSANTPSRLLNKDGMLRQLIIAVILAYTSSLVEGNWPPILSCIDFSLSFPLFKITLYYTRGVYCNTVFFVAYKLGWPHQTHTNEDICFSVMECMLQRVRKGIVFHHQITITNIKKVNMGDRPKRVACPPRRFVEEFCQLRKRWRKWNENEKQTGICMMLELLKWIRRENR